VGVGGSGWGLPCIVFNRMIVLIVRTRPVGEYMPSRVVATERRVDRGRPATLAPRRGGDRAAYLCAPAWLLPTVLAAAGEYAKIGIDRGSRGLL
jgi:hypothetical protein